MNPRSTVGTSTEIYEYLKLLFARVGKTYSPVSGNLVKRDSISDVADFILTLPENTPVNIFSPIPLTDKRGDLKAKCNLLMQQGFTRVMIGSETLRIDEIDHETKCFDKEIYLLVDRLTVHHKDNDTFNNTRVNLEWCTQSYNELEKSKWRNE